jgi:hypothetical protein
MGRRYRFVPVSQMEPILEGLERNEFDAAIGAITLVARFNQFEMIW